MNDDTEQTYDLDMTSLEIHGRRWFQETNGNTYHSVRVIVDGEPVGMVDYTYGYGGQWRETGRKVLDILGYGKPHMHTALRRWCRELGIDYKESCQDVDRKRDLVPAEWEGTPEIDIYDD